MYTQLIIAGAWLAIAAFLLTLNIKVRTMPVVKFVSFYGMAACVIVAMVFLAKFSIQYN